MARLGMRSTAATGAIVLSIATLGGFFVTAHGRSQNAGGGVQIPTELRSRAEREGRVRVIVELELPSGLHAPEPSLPPQAIAAQRRAIESQAARVMTRLSRSSHRLLRRYQTVPYVALEVTPASLALLESSSDVVRVMEDALVRPVLAESAPLIGSDQAWASGFDGSGSVIAVLDTGVDAHHPFLAGKVVEESCFSSTVPGISQSFCPNGMDEQFGIGSAAPCALSGCLHGTHVAGIAAGNGASAGQSFSGVAKGASIFAVQVFSEIIDAESCGASAAPCAAAFTSDVIAALEHVYSRAGAHNLAAVNMSLGGNLFTAACDDEPYKPGIDNLRQLNIASVIASGNSGSRWSISTPSCVSTAISVGSTDKNDKVSWFSNVAPVLSLFAPGGAITSSVPGGGFAVESGTSMAAPHVAGSWAVLRQASPGASVSTLLTTLRQTGRSIADDRFLGTETVPRVQLFQALASLTPITNPAPSAFSVSPDRVRAGTGPVTITITGADFNSFSVVLWNNAPLPSLVVNTTTIEATIPAAELTGGGFAQVAVFTPAPGGGTSAALTVTIDPPPSLAVSTQTAATGTPVTVTLINGYGGSRDWLAFAASGSANNKYLKWTYVGAGVTTRTWTVTMPSTAGTYEFRLFLTGGSPLAATSPVVSVSTAANPVPELSSLSPNSGLSGGQAFTLTAIGSGFAPSSVVRWNGADRPTTFVSSTQVRAAISAEDIAVPGTAQVTVWSPAPGGGLSNAQSFAIGQAPTISVSATSTATGGTVTATLTDGLGGSGDWLALAETTASNTSYIKYTYVGGGVTTRTWTVTMPWTPGTYEFRLFRGFTRLATSPTVTASQGDNPVPTLTGLSPASVVSGGGAFTLTATGTDFVPSSVVRWNGAERPTTFVSSTKLSAAIPAGDIAIAGTAQVTVFTPTPAGGVSAERPLTIGLQPVLSVSATSVSPGSSVTVTLTNGLGGSSDWLALAPTTAGDRSYIRYTYMGQGKITFTWTVTMPTTPGTYEFRLFLNNGYTRAATSPTVTVQ